MRWASGSDTVTGIAGGPPWADTLGQKRAGYEKESGDNRRCGPTNGKQNDPADWYRARHVVVRAAGVNRAAFRAART